MHDLASGAAQDLSAILVKVLKVGLVQGVADNLNVHLVQVLLGETIDNIGPERGILCENERS